MLSHNLLKFEPVRSKQRSSSKYFALISSHAINLTKCSIHTLLLSYSGTVLSFRLCGWHVECFDKLDTQIDCAPPRGWGIQASSTPLLLSWIPLVLCCSSKENNIYGYKLMSENAQNRGLISHKSEHNPRIQVTKSFQLCKEELNIL